MLDTLIAILGWSFLATLFACFEIEIEGKAGWAYDLPTWYRVNGFWAKLYGAMMGGKPLTGYHLFMFPVPLLIVHTKYFGHYGAPWSGADELNTLALFLAWCVVWDFYWFILNPHFKNKFKKEYVWWHKKWDFALIPSDYPKGITLSIALAGAASGLADSTTYLIDHLILLGGFGIYTIILYLLSPRYHRWYEKMHTTTDDEREKVKNFHR